MDEYDHPLIMEYLYAALLLHKLKRDITEDSVKNVLKATGSTPDEVRVKALIAALSEVNIDEALKVAQIGITPSSTPSAGTTSAPGGTPPSKEEEKKEEKKEEEALEGLSALFG